MTMHQCHESTWKQHSLQITMPKKHVYFMEGLLGPLHVVYVYWVCVFHVVLKLVLACAALGRVMAYATFISVVMRSGPRGCCGGPTASYSTARAGVISFFLES